jgi:hypothetical protein
VWYNGRLVEPFLASDLRLGDVLVLRKAHPCGSDRWVVVRLGADIGLRCHGCRRRVLVPRSRMSKIVRAVAERGPASDRGDHCVWPLSPA